MSIDHNIIIFYFYKWKYFVCSVLQSIFSRDQSKCLFTPWKLGLIKKSKFGFGACTDTFGWHLLQWIIFLKPDVNYSSSFPLFRVDKVTTGIKSFVSVFANVVAFVSLDNTHLPDQVKKRLTP